MVCLASTIYCSITGFNDLKEMDPELIAPFLRKYLKIKPNENYQLTTQSEDKPNVKDPVKTT